MDREEVQALALKAGLARKCSATNCGKVTATGEDDEELVEWLQSHAHEDAEDVADILRDFVSELPDECGCERSERKLIASAKKTAKAQWIAR